MEESRIRGYTCPWLHIGGLKVRRAEVHACRGHKARRDAIANTPIGVQGMRGSNFQGTYGSREDGCRIIRIDRRIQEKLEGRRGIKGLCTGIK